MASKYYLSGIKFLSLFIVFLFTSSQHVNAQDEKLERAKNIYSNLEYNTIAFNDLKPVWDITEPGMVRHIFNRFVVKNAFRINGLPAESYDIENRIQYIYDGKVFIELRKRYYDDEIEYIRFYTPQKNDGGTSSKNYFFDPVEDHLVIKKILGENTYEYLKSRLYSDVDLTKSESSTSRNYNFDIFLHFTQPKLMFYKMNIGAKNRLLFSYFGRWGNDHINYPGWYFTDYFMGVSTTFMDSILPKSAYSGYTLDLGFGIPARQPTFTFNDDSYGRRLYKGGENIYFRLTGNPLKMVMPELARLHFKLEGMFRVAEYGFDDFNIDYITQFYSLNNFFVFFADYREFVNVLNMWNLNAGLGFSINDIVHNYIVPDLRSLTELNSGREGTKFNLFTEASLIKSNGMLKHNLTLQINYDFSDNYGYFGFKSRVMLSKVFGFEFKYYKGYNNNTQAIPYYRLDNYLVFSPIIRINY
ncbi:MAG: hypothetical protein SCALA702_28630 [Melioribacteraceae bacterium]|nr:MAG: hypothetical protein SCALA702_28630 [Melioribacteraceae bacterium]